MRISNALWLAIVNNVLEKEGSRTNVMFFTKLGGAGDRFGDFKCVDCTNFPCVRGHPIKRQKFHHTYHINSEVYSLPRHLNM